MLPHLAGGAHARLVCFLAGQTRACEESAPGDARRRSSETEEEEPAWSSGSSRRE